MNDRFVTSYAMYNDSLQVIYFSLLSILILHVLHVL